MNTSASRAQYEYVKPAELSGATRTVPVIIVGAGPVGVACAIDLALQGVETILLDDNNTVSTGSRAICYAKRTLEILDRLGCGEPVVRQGVSWQVGKVFFGDRLAYSFNLLPEPGHKRPAFVNLQQFYLEEAMLARLLSLDGTEVRWCNRVTGVTQHPEGVTVTIETPDGTYCLSAQYVIAADGARSTMREAMGLEAKGQVFRDRFLIADVKMKGEFPTERWFWFDPPFHRNQSVLLHRQADDVWRIDFQLGWDADPEEERKPERVLPRLRAMLGDDRPIELEWVSVYTFQCRRLDKFVHGRVVFAGDAAHQVSPFGARGANSGIQDADNLCWKLARVVKGQAPEDLLRSYDVERVEAADENILNSTRATDFITPKSEVSKIFRDAVLALAERHAFARTLVNSGRLSLPSAYSPSQWITSDEQAYEGGVNPGAVIVDAPIAVGANEGWLVDATGGLFEVLYFASGDARLDESRCAELLAINRHDVRISMFVRSKSTSTDAAKAQVRTIVDSEGQVFARYGASGGEVYLLRPDQYVAGRWRTWSVEAVTATIDRAEGKSNHTREVGDAQHRAEHRAA